MTSRPLASLTALLLWVALAILWLAWALVALLLRELGYEAAKAVGLRGRSRWRRWVPIPDFPRWGRIRDVLPGRRRQVRVEARPIRRMSSREKDGLLAIVFARDGRGCAECDCVLDPRLNHRHPQHPELHHLIAWSLCKHEPWANEPVNLVALCQPCHAPLGNTRTTPRLEAKRRELLDHYGYEEAA